MTLAVTCAPALHLNPCPIATPAPGLNYRDYVDFLVKWSVITQKVPTSDLITNDLIEDINRMDVGKIAAEAAAYRYRR